MMWLRKTGQATSLLTSFAPLVPVPVFRCALRSEVLGSFSTKRCVQASFGRQDALKFASRALGLG